MSAVEAERDRLKAELSDLRNGWANSVKAHADALAERDALDAIASKLQHDHDMMALANGKLEAERDAAFAAGQEDMRERVVYSVKLTCGLLEGVGYTEFSARVRDLTDCISSLPIKPHP